MNFKGLITRSQQDLPFDGITLQELLHRFSIYGHYAFIVVITLPFVQPIPLPGVSTIIGLVIFIVGVLLFLGREPWLPRRFRETRISAEHFILIHNVALKVNSYFERFLKRRQEWIFQLPFAPHLNSAVIAGGGLALSLPLPVPFSNALPAWTVILIALAILEEDGLLLIIGYVVGLISVLFFVAIAVAAYLGINYI